MIINYNIWYKCGGKNVIKFIPDKTCVLDMKNDNHLDVFIKALLCSGYTISQSESTKDDCVKIYISDNKFARNEDNDEIC